MMFYLYSVDQTTVVAALPELMLIFFYSTEPVNATDWLNKASQFQEN